MQERHLLPFAAEQLTPEENRALRSMQAQRRWRVIASLGAGLLALAIAGCPEPADLENANGYPAPPGSMPAPTGGSGGSSMGGGGTGGGSTGVECEVACMDTVLVSACNGCHGANLQSANLTFEPKPYTQYLKDKPATHIDANGACPSGDKLIDTATPANSWLLKKVTDPGTCGSLMPLGIPLTDAQKKCFQDYVNCVAGVK